MSEKRWLPRQGEPETMTQRISQACISKLAILPVYTAIVVTLVLYVQVFGVPFVAGV